MFQNGRFYTSRILKIDFTILGALNFVNLVNCSLQKVQKFIKNQNSQSLNVLKRQILQFQNFEKLISHKILVIENHEVFTLCSVEGHICTHTVDILGNNLLKSVFRVQKTSSIPTINKENVMHPPRSLSHRSEAADRD